MTRLLWLGVIAAALAGCVTKRTELYAWGNYEDVIYRGYTAPGKYPPQARVETLEKDYQEARASNERLPPGWHAHLGYLYFQLGKQDQARQEFMTEKAQFPESTLLMDRLLANLDKP
jgi:hypothetical protein